MKTAMMAVSFLALVVLLLLPTLHAAGAVSAAVSQHSITAGTLLWFATAPFWMRYRPSSSGATQS